MSENERTALASTYISRPEFHTYIDVTCVFNPMNFLSSFVVPKFPAMLPRLGPKLPARPLLHLPGLVFVQEGGRCEKRPPPFSVWTRQERQAPENPLWDLVKPLLIGVVTPT